MRIGLVSPYSLTVPGGVQAQVLGLARELRRRGHEARVLGPCDGPPPESFVTPLGNSLPTAANGSMAPLAPDASAALRTIRALNDEAFDVIHLHEPMAPGITMTALLVHRAPDGRHVPRGGNLRRLPSPAAGAAPGRRTGSTTASSCPRTRSSWCGNTSAATTTSCSTASTSTRFGPHRRSSVTRNGETPRTSRRSSSAVATRNAKDWRCCCDAVEQLDGPVTVWVASNGPETAALMARHRAQPNIVWLGRIPEAEKFSRLRSCDVFCAPSLGGESFGVVLVEAMAAGATVVASELDGYRNVATDRVDSLLVAPGRRRRARPRTVRGAR